jgi:hypothetical protein
VNNDSSVILSFFLPVLDFLGRLEIFTNSALSLSLISLNTFKYLSSDSSFSHSPFKNLGELILLNKLCASISSSSDKFAASSHNNFTNASIFDNTFSSNHITLFDSSVGKKLYIFISLCFVQTLFTLQILCITLVGFQGMS